IGRARRPVRQAEGHAARQARRETEGLPRVLGGRASLRSAAGDGAVHMTMDELLRLNSRLTTVHVERWVARRMRRPVGDSEAWVFEQVDVAGAGLLAELVGDVGLDEDTMEAVIGLIDQVHTLRGQLELLARAIGEQPPATRQAIAAALQRLSGR